MRRSGFAVLLFLIVAAVLLFATTTATLRPTADGSLDSANFTAGGTACNATTCFSSVSETTGANCSATIVAGDSTSIVSATLNAKQSFTISLSSVPDGSVVQSIDVHTCAQRGATADSARLLMVLATVEADCGTTFAPGASFGEFNCVISPAATTVKASGTVAEIGVKMEAAKTINFTTFAATVTYIQGGRRSQTIVARLEDPRQ